MISYIRIGHFGRVGNQLFQFAAAFGVAKKNGYDLFFPEENTTIPSVENFKDGVTREVTFQIPSVFEVERLLKPINDIRLEFEVHEPHFHFSPYILDIPDSTNLHGYFQSEKYFEHCKEELIETLKFKKEISEFAEREKKKYDGELVSVHVRVGDYKHMQMHHPVCQKDYYVKAMELFKGSKFLVFSDDLEHCRTMFEGMDDIYYSESHSDSVDMCLMSLCDHNIIANSSFSWWAAYLNKNKTKQVVAPTKWFGPSYNGINDTKDLYCKEWIKL